MYINKNAIITGAGRNKGIGAEICRMLTKKGINVYFTSDSTYDEKYADIISSEYIQTMDDCKKNDVKVFFATYDLTNEDNIKKLFIDATNKLGNIDILINCACFHMFDSLEKISEELLEMNFNVNSKLPLLLCKEFYLKYRGNSGRIINFTSTQDLESLTTEISYAVSKATVSTITSTLAPIMAQKGITINSINPGATDIGDKHDYTIHLYKNSNLFGRLGSPTDAANLVCFLISDEGKWITGQTINSEGALFRNII